MQKMKFSAVKIFFLMVLTISGIVFTGNVVDLNKTVSEIQPKSAAVVDFSIDSSSVTYDECKGVSYFKAEISSASGSLPDSVLAIVNGTEYPLTAVYYDETGALGNNISTGIVYSLWLCNLTVGIYTVNYTVGNATGRIGLTVNKTLNIATSPVANPFTIYSTGTRREGQNGYTFMVKLAKFNCTLPQALITLDGVNYTMTWDSSFRDANLGIAGAFVKFFDFGLDDNKTHYYNYTIWSGNYSKIEGAGNQITCVRITRTTSVGGQIPLKHNGTQVTYYVLYYNWEKVAPKELIAELNGVNTTLDIKKEYTKFWNCRSLQTSFNCTMETWQDWDQRNVFAYGPFEISLTVNMTYNLTIWAFNGTEWVKHKTLENEFWYIVPANIFTVTVDSYNMYNKTFWFWQYRYFNVTLKITCNVPGITIGTTRKIKYESVKGTGEKILTEVDPTDANLADGKLYNAKDIEIWMLDSYLWGDIGVRLEIDYTNGTWIHKFWSQIIILDLSMNLTAGAIGTYGIKVNDWYIYNDTYYGADNCCSILSNGESSKTLYQIVAVGRTMRSDYYEYITYSWDKCREQWIRSDCVTEYMAELGLFGNTIDPFYRKGATRVYLDPERVETYIYQKFLPKNKLDYILQYYINQTISNYVKKSGDSLIMEWTIGCKSFKGELKINSNGIVTLQETTVKIGSTYSMIKGIKLLKSGSGNLPTDDGSGSTIAGYDIFYILGLGFIAFAIIGLSMRRRFIY